MTDTVAISCDGHVAVVTLNRPDAYNAFNAAMRRDLAAAVDTIDQMDDIRVVILKGSGKGFCAGADLRDRAPGKTSLMLDREYRPIMSGIMNSPKIWIAQIHGSAAGIGAALAQSCDLLVMADDASIYMAFAAIALVPDGGNSWFLLQKMGYHRAFQTIAEGRKIPAGECHDLGIANEVCAPDDLDATATALAARMAATAPLATSAAKHILRSQTATAYEQAFALEARAQDLMRATEDHVEGVTAFSEKRAPVYKGR